MKCIWCNKETTSDKSRRGLKIEPVYANKEHIFPEGVGGKKNLEIGKVCEECNNRLGQKIDESLKTQNWMMMKQYQDSSEILIKSGIQKRPLGKKGRTPEDKKRKKDEMLEIEGYSGGTKISRNPINTNEIKLLNLPDGSGGDYTYNDKFSKALHKCAVNVLLEKYDYKFMKTHFSELIDFVNKNDNENYLKWSYAVSYANIFSKVHFEPFCLQELEIDGIPKALVLIFPCAIFIVCTSPNLFDTQLLDLVSANLPKMESWENKGFDYFKHFTNAIESSRKSFGEKVKFTFIKKEITGRRNMDDSFYLLTNCKTCGQTNPTGFMLSKESILDGNQNHSIGGNRNTWNKLSIEDLRKKGLVIEKWSQKSLQKQIDQGIYYPAENDVKKMNISNCKVQCINCYEWIEYDAKHCFI
jgi:hypothetical protein|tara:strand:+ start:768 stop:2006 length:1239 start_codon:yes stop_codon:yes gene_type:complete